jgi:hypothetical protein
MGTRRRHRKRGGDPFIPNPNATGPAGMEREKKRYEEWLAKREVEARAEASAREDIEKGKEEDAKMASFNKMRMKERRKEIDDLRKLEQERRERLQEQSNPCINILKQAGITGTPAEKRTAYRKFALKNHPDKGGDQEVFKKVDGCYKASIGAGRKTRRRKSRRRR